MLARAEQSERRVVALERQLETRQSELNDLKAVIVLSACLVGVGLATVFDSTPVKLVLP